jgi:hypothetical protein
VALLVLATGCRQLLGLQDLAPPDAAPDAADTEVDAAADAPSDAMADATADASCPDADHDGICDAVDDWPCGPKPLQIPMLTISGGMGGVTLWTIALTNITVDAVVAPGAMVPYQFDYDIHDSSCVAGCLDQIEIGLVPGMRLACSFDGFVTPTTGKQATAKAMFPAPTTPGAYDVRVGLGQNTSCTAGGATNWWMGTPPATHTWGHLCVR